MSYDVESTATIAYSLLQKIDSGEANLFLEKSKAKSDDFIFRFFDDDVTGVFVSFPYMGALRVQISLSEDTDKYTDVIAEMILQSKSQSGVDRVFVWLQNENRAVINGLQEQIEFNPKGINNSHYASVEYIMPRGNSYQYDANSFDIQGYDEVHIGRYLQLLDESMDFEDPPPSYAKREEAYKRKFTEKETENSFEALWNADELIGFYWRSSAEIDVIAVAKKWQRSGIGTHLLTRAIDVIMNKTDAPFAYLYCVDWNEKAQRFYVKYGMIKNGHSYGLSIG